MFLFAAKKKSQFTEELEVTLRELRCITLALRHTNTVQDSAVEHMKATGPIKPPSVLSGSSAGPAPLSQVIAEENSSVGSDTVHFAANSLTNMAQGNCRDAKMLKPTCALS